MLFTDASFIGIDPTAGVRSMRYVALDRHLKLIAHDKGDLSQVLAFVGAQETAVVGIDGPQDVGKGILSKAHIRTKYNLTPGSKTWQDWRVCEYELRRRNIRIYNTPQDTQKLKPWVQTSISLFESLRRLGFVPFQLDEPVSSRMLVEARSHACFSLLLKRRPFLKETLEGRLQRQLVLFLEGVDLPNPMFSLEEITRHHLLTGNLPRLYGKGGRRAPDGVPSCKWMRGEAILRFR